ncbi:MAG: hypothetical protein ACOY3X_04035 [Pseudomonadota bacterium]
MRVYTAFTPFLLLFLLLPILPMTAASAGTLTIAAPPDVIADHDRLLAGRKPAAVTRYDGPGSRRDVVELILVQQALILAGNQRPVELVPAPTYMRMLAMVADGHAELTGTSVWASDIDNDAERLQASTPLIAEGEFHAAFFHAHNNSTGVRERIRNGDWEHLAAVSSRSWKPDWKALHHLGLAQVYDVPEWPAMVRMVSAGRADFLLAPFPADRSGSLQFDGMQLDAVPGVCLPLAGSRHLAVARSRPETLSQLERGLNLLRQKAVIRRAYTEAGFWSEESRSCRPVAGKRRD